VAFRKKFSKVRKNSFQYLKNDGKNKKIKGRKPVFDKIYFVFCYNEGL